jgi:hypothetical protein
MSCPFKTGNKVSDREDSFYMSEFTFNIADYRPLSAVRQHRVPDTIPALKRPEGFVVLTSESREHQFEWLEPRPSVPSVVDIRSVREGHQMAQLLCLRRGKVLRFTGQWSDLVHTMQANANDSQPDDDPNDPMAA